LLVGAAVIYKTVDVVERGLVSGGRGHGEIVTARGRQRKRRKGVVQYRNAFRVRMRYVCLICLL
jgi:hypothetical protein